MSTTARSVIGAAIGLVAGAAAFEWQQVMMGNQLVIAACLAICSLTGWSVGQQYLAE